VGSRESYAANYEIAELHDYWRKGLGWVGPNGGPDYRRSQIVLKTIRPSFIAYDSIGDIIGNSLARGAQMQPGDNVIYAGTSP